MYYGKTRIKHCIVELGDDWDVALPDTEVELDFISQRLTGFADAQDFFIAGSAFPDQNSRFRYLVRTPLISNYSLLLNDPSYSPIQTGNEDPEYK